MRLFKITAVILFLVLLLAATVFVTMLGAADPTAEGSTEFVVTAGESTGDIAQRLEREGLIKNSATFFAYMKLVRAKILPGVYDLSSADSASQIGWSLGSGRFKTERITIIEGWRVTQIAEYLIEEKKLRNVSDFVEKAVPYEGYLFPDTYEVRVDVTSEALIALMRDNFTRRTAGLRITPETVILASIVEREARSDTDRPLIAGVYANRINIGMRLQADPTVQYAKGSWRLITVDDYSSTISPYNTYLNDGLPPGPIASPGLKSLQAAADPAGHDHFFFFHAKGETHFSKTHEEHRAKVRQYLR
jgi:UPF0755 protein